MNTTENIHNTKNTKRTYCSPNLEFIKLDNEISLVLVSGDPGDPYSSIVPEYFNSQPFRTELG